MGAAALTFMPPPLTPKPRRAPVQLEIVQSVVEKPAATLGVEPTEPEERGPAPEPKTEQRKKKKERAEPRAEQPDDVEAGVQEGGGGEVEGTGPIVEGGSGVGGDGKTKDGRDLSSLDLKPRLSVPRFEDQSGGIVIPERPKPQKDPRRRPTKDGGWRYDDSTFAAKVGPDGTVTFDERGHESVDLLPDSDVGGWRIDVNDWILSAAGDDPYSYEKRRFIEATREERLAMARAACGARLSASLVELPERLDKVWRSARPIEEKRQILFDLWDDCAEEGTPEVMRYGELARLTILDFIQKHLPEGSETAYTQLELEKLNERRASSKRFDPYGARL